MSVQKKSARASILDAAAKAFAEHGVDQTSIDDISRTMNALKKVRSIITLVQRVS